MNNKIKETINGYGVLFRFVTPILVVMVGYFISTGIDDLKIKLRVMDSHFTNHLMHHQDLEVGYADRLAKIEGSRFTDKDGTALEDRITAKIPPKWVANKLLELEKKVDVSLEKIEKLRR